MLVGGEGGRGTDLHECSPGFCDSRRGRGDFSPSGSKSCSGYGQSGRGVGGAVRGSWGALGRELFRPYGSPPHARTHAHARVPGHRSEKHLSHIYIYIERYAFEGFLI